MEEITEFQDGGNQIEEQSQSIDTQDIMESMMRITFCGLGGTIVGLSLEKRLEATKLTTAEGVAAAARRKRGQIASSHQSSYPLSVTWAVSCMVFCSIMEVSRLTSPSTRILKQVEAMSGTLFTFIEHDDDPNSKKKSAVISVADYSIGGTIAGVVCSFGRRMYSRNSVMKLHGPRRLAGLLPGLALGIAAGTIQSAIDYGTERLKESSMNNSE
mmetsp:Transcript_7455/g.16027  ORF Transcript_7455/g.16027 Transcript_7455/m.16027 type:complete len:214 (-) Transcript_7455:466-1107(-)|eukprot:CAMPEP_0168169034 /NCGR_PEP_ID=MMETSP0139_2-20121125/3426_1 /TAXON_ID=44445 /ORGANISM="Pseudo-nitzschia australis, Strain 10249 10 AB" /LENGTH=213 /DNA_ID=CAMNT_0008086433 /DNA_START=157 /DNA_END=798 /DNA_ORIENTATION=-